MTSGKQTPVGRAEYRLRISAEQNEADGKYVTVVRLETTRQFAAFRYELAVEETISEKTIRYRMTGLRPPGLSLPASGPAQFRREYDSLYGTYHFTVEGLDRKAASFIVDIREEKLTLNQGPDHQFLEVIID